MVCMLHQTGKTTTDYIHSFTQLFWGKITHLDDFKTLMQNAAVTSSFVHHLFNSIFIQQRRIDHVTLLMEKTKNISSVYLRFWRSFVYCFAADSSQERKNTIILPMRCRCTQFPFNVRAMQHTAYGFYFIKLIETSFLQLFSQTFLFAVTTKNHVSADAGRKIEQCKCMCVNWNCYLQLLFLCNLFNSSTPGPNYFINIILLCSVG